MDDGEDVFGSFKITAVKKPILSGKDITMNSAEKKYYEACLMDAKHNKLAGKKIIFYSDSKKIKTTKTDRYGYAYLQISDLSVGKHTLTAKYDGAIFTKKITVKSVFNKFQKATVKNAKKMTIKLQTKKVDGKYLKGKTVKVEVIGKKYKAKIDSNGVVKLSIKKSAFAKCVTKKYSDYFVSVTYGKDTQWATLMFNKVKPTLTYKITPGILK